MIVQDDSGHLVLFSLIFYMISGKGREFAMFGFLIALLSGALMSIQGVFNTQVTKSSTIWVANAFVQFTAFYGPHVFWRSVQGTAQVYAARRRNWRFYHLYRY